MDLPLETCRQSQQGLRGSALLARTAREHIASWVLRAEASIKWKERDFSVTGAKAGQLCSTSAIDCQLVIPGTEEVFTLPLQVCTKVQVRCAKLGYVQHDTISFVVKQGCTYKRLQNSDQARFRAFRVMPYSTVCTTPLSNFEARGRGDFQLITSRWDLLGSQNCSLPTISRCVGGFVRAGMDNDTVDTAIQFGIVRESGAEVPQRRLHSSVGEEGYGKGRSREEEREEKYVEERKGRKEGNRKSMEGKKGKISHLTL
eukprot:Skav214509  [mRNA]  locus=scaffold1011:397681:415139:- [translate_table: standard]